jgi:hypothetical protein
VGKRLIDFAERDPLGFLLCCFGVAKVLLCAGWLLRLLNEMELSGVRIASVEVDPRGFERLLYAVVGLAETTDVDGRITSFVYFGIEVRMTAAQ